MTRALNLIKLVNETGGGPESNEICDRLHAIGFEEHLAGTYEKGNLKIVVSGDGKWSCSVSENGKVLKTEVGEGADLLMHHIKATHGIEEELTTKTGDEYFIYDRKRLVVVDGPKVLADLEKEEYDFDSKDRGVAMYDGKTFYKYDLKTKNAGDAIDVQNPAVKDVY